jgi:hypothetical protein
MMGQHSVHSRISWNSNAGAAAAATGRDNDVAVSYQIDCQTTKKGKMIAGTKRRICWKFGFSNRDAVRRGLSGTDCRGEEHEVVFVWSLTSGKKFVLADGHEVHWSKQSLFSETFDGAWQCSWQSQMAGAKRELTVVAHARKNNSSVADGGFRNFDLLIDGVSFSDMPQMFELGLTKTVEDQRRIRMGGGTNAQMGTHAQHQHQPPVRRKHMYNTESDLVSHHSSQSDLPYYHEQHSPVAASNELLSQSMHGQPYQQRQQQLVSVAASNELTSQSMHEQPYQQRRQQQQQQQQQQAPLAASNELLSQSMPDIRYNFSASPTSVMAAGGASVPHLNYQFQSHPSQDQLQQENHVSPTSVRQVAATNNPFDLYTTATMKPYQQQPQPQQQQFGAAYW